mmetsp:Transcript_11799/g.19376  ORF Transcript_11799/g.19376 Transcript_11799/m.19376 type:complete len:99 (+) Transcript_11799:844-1140(+)
MSQIRSASGNPMTLVCEEAQIDPKLRELLWPTSTAPSLVTSTSHCNAVAKCSCTTAKIMRAGHWDAECRMEDKDGFRQNTWRIQGVLKQSEARTYEAP